MDSTSPVTNNVSPESTVTTLLSSSGHLRGSLLVTDLGTAFKYQDKEYDSASAALEAYIADFDKSHNFKSSIFLPQSPLYNSRRPRMSTFRNKSVHRERLTSKDVDFLTLPVSSLRHRDNHDRLSMTTDELLSVPRDGSMPVTHTTAFIQGVLSQSVPSNTHIPSRPGSPAGDDMFYLRSSRNCRSCRCKKEPEVPTLKQDVPFVRCLTCAHRAAKDADMSPSLRSLGRVTGNKADMDDTTVSSVEEPELKYPAWILNCDFSEPPPPSQEDSQQSLRNLRLQFAEQISLLASDRKKPNFTESLLRGNHLESLIQKADQVVNFLCQSFGAADSANSARIDAVSPVNSEELHVCSSSTHIESAKAAEGIPEAPSEEIHQTRCGSQHGCSISEQPGPLEALKQMMFRLQTVETALQQPQPPNASASTNCWQSEEALKRSEGEAEQTLSGGLSLQRALHHLSRLKLLLEEPREMQDEDEGWYSSLSNDRPARTKQDLC
ncbi:lung adenoma susceptibility protein 2 [Entelurus aequoreus]|uniref:lung adenoma susceptibility protein 2 n=1 Tax=Entelurus aequoreus TaxID=161455 RepID=UPI002B1D434F|nr:lung adenoma susceptibility protein 2 [Entelurus aequoreus]